ncbi:hypothetical protein PZQ55_001055 [Clostridium botulinum]|nr:hypothetical protein [Clostridium botulinum]EKO2042084.1 hypothetical protein [Clostridium botulinum]
MNDIYVRQNQDEILILQYSQRKHYEFAEKLQYFLWISMVINICIVNNENLKVLLGRNIITSIGVIYTIIYTIIKFAINNYIKIGAFTKELIDCKLYKFDVTKRLINSNYTIDKLKEKAVSKKNKYKDDYMVQIQNTGKDKPPGLRNWYEDRKYKDINRAIYECQCENLWWDEKLSTTYMVIFVSIGAVIIGSLLLANKDTTILVLIFGIIIPGIQIIIELLTQLYFFNEIVKKYRTKVGMLRKEIEKDMAAIKMERLLELQDIILERRLYKFLIPTMLHRILSKKYHELRQAL